jgi:teichuronic acid biosynthesis glycosyltransferase TuaG
MRNILISIIIPYYRKKKYIKKTLDSVLNQTYKNIEILIIYDDKNKDDLRYLKTIIANNSKIKIINNKKNIGPGFSRNKGIRNSKGKYIAFIDSDDIWKKNKLKYQLKQMLKMKYDFSHTSYSILNDKNKVTGVRVAKSYSDIDKLIKSCDIGLSTVMLKSRILKKFNFPSLKTKEDFVLWINIIKSGHTLLGINKNLTFWRNVKNSQSSNIMQKLLDGYRVYNKYLKFNFIMSMYYLLILCLNFLKKSK